jgi:caffeoyl-CoA O-methyltransferase
MADNDSRAGVNYSTPEILAYLNKVHTKHDEGLQRAFEAPEKNEMPAIMVGPAEGKLLRMLLQLINAKKVVELGTLAGYSAISMARMLPEDGHLYSIEYNPKNAQVSKENIAAAGLQARISVLVGAGNDVLPTLNDKGPFDAVFIDADKVNYDHYGRWAAQHTRKGGLLLGDNALLFGRLLEDTAEAAAMRRFHEEAREFFETVCIYTQDGLLLGIRK